MSDKTGIEWTEATWNPVTGCSKVSQGCKHCYAERDWPRMQHVPAYAGRKFTDVACHPDRLDIPLRWTKPRLIFVNSMSDLFHESVPDDFIDRVFAVMALAKQHTFQVLTKRPERMLAYLSDLGLRAELIGIEAEAIGGIDRHTEDLKQRWPLPLQNVWLGVSVEDQKAADERIPLLLQTPAAVRWISAEPLLGPIDLRRSTGYPWIGGKFADGRKFDGLLDWVVVGGESGNNARPMHPNWARGLRDQCAAAEVPFLFKQWGEFANQKAASLAIDDCMYLSKSGGWVEIDGTYSSGDQAAPINSDAAHVFRIGKKAAGRLLAGVEHNGYPTV
jgi:protein gp37